MFNPKVFVAEFIGTFALVFVGAAAGLYQVGIVGVALAYGLAVIAFMYALGHVSGMHINPAVTLGLALNGTIKWLEALVYWVAQLAGAVLAAFALKTFVGLLDPNAFAGMASNGLLTTQFPYYAMGVEALLTFLLVSVVLQVVDGKTAQSAAVAVGVAYMIAVFAGAPLTGASLNPARSFGPAIFTSTVTPGTPDFQNPMFYLVYFVGPFIGSVIAVILYQFFKYEFVTVDDVDDMEDDDELVEVVETEEVVAEEPSKKPARKKTKE